MGNCIISAYRFEVEIFHLDVDMARAMLIGKHDFRWPITIKTLVLILVSFRKRVPGFLVGKQHQNNSAVGPLPTSPLRVKIAS